MLWLTKKAEQRFNTQPPEGGWASEKKRLQVTFCFNTQPPEGGWLASTPRYGAVFGFNTQPPEGGWFKRMV